MSRIQFVTAFAALSLIASGAQVASAREPEATSVTTPPTTDYKAMPATPSKTTAAIDGKSTASPMTHHTAASTAGKHVAMPRFDLNQASAEELEKLPGVDETIAEKIVAARPFKSRSELLTKKIVTKAEYQKLRSHVMVKPEPMAAAKTTK